MDELGLKTNRSRLYWLIFILAVVVSMLLIFFVFSEKVANDVQPTVVKQDSDQVLFARAIDMLDLNSCTKISSIEQRKGCVDSVNDAIILKDSISLNDKALCERIVSEVVKSNCFEIHKVKRNISE